MIQFILIFIIMLLFRLLTYKYDKNGKYFFIVFFIFYFILNAFRATNIGNDTLTYCNLFDLISHNSFSFDNFGRFEEGYLLLNKLLTYISNNSQILLFVTSTIIYLTYFKFIKKESCNYWLITLLFFISGYFRFSISAIRQCLAICIVIYSYYYLRNDNLLIFGILTIFSFLFHRSALIAEFLLFIASKKWNKKYYIVGFSISVFLVITYESFFKNIVISFFDFSRYIGSIYDDGINIATIILICLTLMNFIIVFYKNKNTMNDFHLKIVFIKLLILILSLKLNSLDRLAEYFTIFELVAVSNVLWKYNVKNRLIITCLLIAVYFSYSLTWGILRPDIQMIWPFKFFWNI